MAARAKTRHRRAIGFVCLRIHVPTSRHGGARPVVSRAQHPSCARSGPDGRPVLVHFGLGPSTARPYPITGYSSGEPVEWMVDVSWALSAEGSDYSRTLELLQLLSGV